MNIKAETVIDAIYCLKVKAKETIVVRNFKRDYVPKPALPEGNR